MKLAHFIRKHQKEIIDEWTEYAQENITGVNDMDLEGVRDSIKKMLECIADNMEKSQSEEQQKKKSKENEDSEPGKSKGAKQHGAQRAEKGFDIVELSSEFRALRASVLRLWENKTDIKNWEDDFHDMIRFNEAIDEAWMASTHRFHHQVDESKNWFLGILGHDLRNPLAAISGVNSILAISENLSEKERELIKRSNSSLKRMTELINNLLELTNLRLGSGIGIKKSVMDLSKQSEKIIQELQLAYPQADLITESPGPVQGEWDSIRMDQLMTNLIANALRHGRPGGPVKIKISAEGNEVVFQIHNEGQPIPKNIKEMIFTGMFKRSDKDTIKESSYGLGLYIVKEIVDGHKGNIKVESTEEEGTTFTITLPRH